MMGTISKTRKYTIRARYRKGYKFVMFLDTASFSTRIYFRISPKKRILLKSFAFKPIKIAKKDYGNVIKQLKLNDPPNFLGKLFD